MEEEKTTFKSVMRDIMNSIALKCTVIAFLILVLMIPKFMVEDLVHERRDRSHDVIQDISSKWGGSQLINGPVLTIPISRIVRTRGLKGQVIETLEEKTIHSYPEILDISGEMGHEERKRSIFSAVLYDADLKVKARFKAFDRQQYPINSSWKVHLDKAMISVGISDPTGISSAVDVKINNQVFQGQPGVLLAKQLGSGFHVKYPLKDKALDITFDMKLRGSASFAVYPAGKETRLALKSTWADPSFQGSFLPHKREINENGFTANWEVHDLQRSSKQTWTSSDIEPAYKFMTVNFLLLNDAYQPILRLIKYAILFIIFTFAAVFITERLTGAKVHPLQYFITGLASLIFYLLLLSLSEQFAFNKSYLICSLLTTALITGYSKGIFRGWRVSATMGGVCIFLYSFLFGTLQLQDYALLMGSVGLFVILAIVMFLTRKLNSEELAPLEVKREFSVNS